MITDWMLIYLTFGQGDLSRLRADLPIELISKMLADLAEATIGSARLETSHVK
jgi:hypothetical protein